jgi:hypothetical protein
MLISFDVSLYWSLWETAVYSTLHKVVSPGEFLIIKQESASD